jgi:hypothetical protein
MAGSRRNANIKPGLSVLPGGQSSKSKYDEAEFLVGGKGTGPGDTVKESFRIHEGYIAEVQRWVQSGIFPYESWSDLYRHAIVRHLTHFLPSVEGEVEGSVLYQLRQIDEVVARETFHLKFTKSIASIANLVRQIIEVPGGKAEVGRMIRTMKKQIDRMRPGFWRSYYESMFMREFSVYLNSGLVVLSAGSDEDGGDGESFPEGLPQELLQELHANDDLVNEDDEREDD